MTPEVVLGKVDRESSRKWREWMTRCVVSGTWLSLRAAVVKIEVGVVFVSMSWKTINAAIYW